jgi:FkbM family methyltransferase
MKKLLYRLFPNSFIEKMKLWYYNSKVKMYTFKLQNNVYATSELNKWTILTNKPLYFIVNDLDRYEKYYNVKMNDVVFDCGANNGTFSLVYSHKVGGSGKVFAFEPDSQNIVDFKQNMLLNNNCTNVELINKAVWNNEDSIVFYEAGSVGSSIFYEDKNSRRVMIQATSIDSFIISHEIKKLNFIKMDIEGAEIEALEGSMETIKKCKPEFAIASYHIINGAPTYIALEAFFKRIGYPYRTEFFNDGEIMTYAGISQIN